MDERGDYACLEGISKYLLAPARKERRDAMEHRRRILEVARQLFAQQGVEATSMHQIAQVAGVGQGTLYRRYAHKGELCQDLLQERHEHMLAEVAHVLTEQQTASALEQLDSVLRLFINLLEEEGALLGPVAGMIGHSLPSPEKEQHNKFHQMPFYTFLYELLVRLLTAAVESGELAALDIPFVADAMLTTLNPHFYHFQRRERGLPSERILQGLRQIYIQGVRGAV